MLTPIQVTEHIMEASYYHKHENRRKMHLIPGSLYIQPQTSKVYFQNILAPYQLCLGYPQDTSKTSEH